MLPSSIRRRRKKTYMLAYWPRLKIYLMDNGIGYGIEHVILLTIFFSFLFMVWCRQADLIFLGFVSPFFLFSHPPPPGYTNWDNWS